MGNALDLLVIGNVTNARTNATAIVHARIDHGGLAVEEFMLPSVTLDT
jgi:hypothetical protein